MKKRKAIVKLSFILAAVIIGIILSVVPMKFGLKDYTPFAQSIRLGIDLKGGVYAIYDVAEDEDLTNIDARLDGTIESLKALLVSKGGFTEATIVRQSGNRLRVEVPNVQNPGQIFEIIGEPADLEFVLEGSVIFDGNNVTDASAQYDSEKQTYGVSLKLDPAGADALFNATGEANRGKVIDILRNGKSISQASIGDPIAGGNAFISGSFTLETAEQLAGQILSGAMGVKLDLKQSNTVSPTLGQDALKLGLIAGGIAMFLIMALLVWIYRGMGGMASFSLLVYVVLLLFFLSVLPWVQLTLPGLAGILLSIGMAVDANVVIFERIKEEYRSGKSISSSTHAGFKKALSAIIDANVTSIIAAIVLWLLGSGPVQGFAITLFLGILLSMFTSLIVTRYLLKQLLLIDKTNSKLFGLRRDNDIVEKPDEETETKKVTAKGGLSNAAQ